jgi:hypothetical protein
MKVKFWPSNENPAYYAVRCDRGTLMIPNNGKWKRSGGVNSPSFTPSIRCLGSENATTDHFTVTNGSVFFHTDAGHADAGRTFPLLDWEEVQP